MQKLHVQLGNHQMETATAPVHCLMTGSANLVCSVLSLPFVSVESMRVWYACQSCIGCHSDVVDESVPKHQAVDC